MAVPAVNITTVSQNNVPNLNLQICLFFESFPTTPRKLSTEELRGGDLHDPNVMQIMPKIMFLGKTFDMIPIPSLQRNALRWADVPLDHEGYESGSGLCCHFIMV